MDEKDCELIEMLWETRNITKAAERLFTTQSALTKRIQKLEEKLGCELFIRSRKGILFTPVAERILPYVRQVSDSMDRIRSQVAIYRKEVAGTLKLGVSINFARYRLADVLKGFMDQYPNVDIHVSTMQSTNLYQSLVKNEISIAIVRGSFKWNEGMVTLSEEPVCLVTAREHAGEPLNSYPYIGRHTDAGFYDKIQLWRAENGCQESRTNLWVDDIGSCLEMVSRGIGWSILPEICLKQFDGQITPLYFKDGTPFTRSSHILYKHDYFELPQVKKFIQEVLAREYFMGERTQEAADELHHT
ncbi:LysR family transcriptional regulator [Enterocloster lavalensis]|uniref:LysR family transcriptional regulator n=2 Tax=Enterocloster lavalensis TaxID=460384 RepID=UPI001D080EF5|nr:LysR family transcriptional regulator [Enterocloster lavalensis]MCB6345151.1 LysR family transcriptional regulator [Enterocloster lavalensis]